MTSLIGDLKYGFRQLAKSPGFTAVVLVVIGVSIAACTALFNAMDQVYMRPLPVREPDELVSVQFRFRHGRYESVHGHCSYPDYEAYRDRSDVFTDLAAFGDNCPMNLQVENRTTLIHGMAVSSNYFSTLGPAPALQMIRRNVIGALKESIGMVPLPKHRWNPHNALIVAQIAIASIVTVFSILCLHNSIGLKRTERKKTKEESDEEDDVTSCVFRSPGGVGYLSRMCSIEAEGRSEDCLGDPGAWPD